MQNGLSSVCVCNVRARQCDKQKPFSIQVRFIQECSHAWNISFRLLITHFPFPTPFPYTPLEQFIGIEPGENRPPSATPDVCFCACVLVLCFCCCVCWVRAAAVGGWKAFQIKNDMSMTAYCPMMAHCTTAARQTFRARGCGGSVGIVASTGSIRNILRSVEVSLLHPRPDVLV